jgi:predicted GNAT family N-acyltransferase
MRTEYDTRLINFSSAEYHSEVKLRDDALRKPLGLSLYDEDLSGEINDIHVGAFVNGKLAGVLILTSLNADDLQMRQVAVSEPMRGKNIGKSMVLFSEEYAKNNGYKKIVLNAREHVVEFYKKLGYEKIGEMFFEVTIPHYRMMKVISNYFQKL